MPQVSCTLVQSCHLTSSSYLPIISDVQGFVNPPRVRGKGQKGKGQKGKGQGKDFMILNKPLTLVKGQGFFRGFPGVSFL